jgi:anion transporter
MTVAVVVAVFAVVYVLIATEKVHRTVAALAGAGVVVAVGIVGAEDIFYSEDTGIDWNVIFLLFGMMVIVSVLRGTGVFEFLAIWAAKRARGRPFPLMVLLILITAVASALLDNVTTVLLIAPVTILLCQRLNLPVIPYLLAEVFASNIGGTATLVGDPPNIIIASRAGLSFNDFLVHLTPVVVVLVAVLIGLCRWLFAGAFRVDEERVAEILSLNEREAIQDHRLLWQSLAVLGIVLAAFVLSPVLGYEPSVVALLGAGLLILLSRSEPRDFMPSVEWETLLFFAGLFVMVGALVKTGVIGQLAEAAARATGGDPLTATMLILFVSALLSGVVDNIPYTAAMSPIVAQLTQGITDPTQAEALWWALAIGADFGGNLTAIGASANVVVLGIAMRSGAPISFWQFTKKGAIVTAVTIALAAPYLWLRYFVVPQ